MICDSMSTPPFRFRYHREIPSIDSFLHHPLSQPSSADSLTFSMKASLARRTSLIGVDILYVDMVWKNLTAILVLISDLTLLLLEMV